MSSLLEKIQEAGVIGCGGAGFPTHVKVGAKVERLLINCAECEPILSADRFVMRHFAGQLVAAGAALMAQAGAAQCTFVLKAGYGPEREALEAAIHASADAGGLGLHLLKGYYPAGDEQAVVYEATGRTVPPLNIPLQVGCAVVNTSTLLAIYNAMAGAPFTHRFLSVDGAVRTPIILYAPLGLSFAECLELAGGVDGDGAALCLISGGPMMGKRFELSQAGGLFVEKTTSGVLALPKGAALDRPLDMRRVRRAAKAACIQCTNCTALCPRHLLGHPLEPHRIMRKLAYQEPAAILQDPVLQSAALCSECGVCEVYACPMGLKPRAVNALLKGMLAQAGMRYPRSEESTAPLSARAERLIPSKRVAARAGVAAYDHGPVDLLRRAEPSRVSIALKQGTGVPAQALVKEGDRVEAGACIARCPAGSLGAHVHASIGGRVRAVGSHIVIAREEGQA